METQGGKTKHAQKTRHRPHIILKRSCLGLAVSGVRDRADAVMLGRKTLLLIFKRPPNDPWGLPGCERKWRNEHKMSHSSPKPLTTGIFPGRARVPWQISFLPPKQILGFWQVGGDWLGVDWQLTCLAKGIAMSYGSSETGKEQCKAHTHTHGNYTHMELNTDM